MSTVAARLKSCRDPYHHLGHHLRSTTRCSIPEPAYAGNRHKKNPIQPQSVHLSICGKDSVPNPHFPLAAYIPAAHRRTSRSEPLVWVRHGHQITEPTDQRNGQGQGPRSYPRIAASGRAGRRRQTDRQHQTRPTYIDWIIIAALAHSPALPAPSPESILLPLRADDPTARLHLSSHHAVQMLLGSLIR
ncbi:hypothetical protein BKA80DRAFT_85548 [Phyllosticta citrichinensis]